MPVLPQVTRDPAKQDTWCWAACLRMAQGAFGVGTDRQCVIVEHEFPGACKSPDGVRRLRLDRVEEVAPKCRLACAELDPCDLETIAAAVRARRLVLLAQHADTNACHFVLVADRAGTASVYDPGFNRKTRALDAEVLQQSAPYRAWTLRRPN